MLRARRIVAVAVLAAVLLLAAACTPSKDQTALKPLIAPPDIKIAGTLRVGVDASYPPYAARQGAEIIGIDADVAAALAERLGLKLQLVDVKPSDVAGALRDGKVDVVLGGMPITDTVLSGATLAGTYLTDGPALFASRPTTVAGDDLSGVTVAVQKDSWAARQFEVKPGSAEVTSFPTLRAAMQAEVAGKVDVVAGDAVVAAYIARDMPSMRFLGQLGWATPLGVAVPDGSPKLAGAVGDALDGLSAGGVLDAIRSKWVGQLPALRVDTGTGTDAGSVDTTSSATQ